jgi:hypothetical protein
MIPTIYNADTLGIRPDLVGGRDKITSWKDLLDPKYKGKTALVDYAPVGVMDVAMALEARGDFKYSQTGLLFGRPDDGKEVPYARGMGLLVRRQAGGSRHQGSVRRPDGEEGYDPRRRRDLGSHGQLRLLEHRHG